MEHKQELLKSDFKVKECIKVCNAMQFKTRYSMKEQPRQVPPQGTATRDMKLTKTDLSVKFGLFETIIRILFFS